MRFALAGLIAALAGRVPAAETAAGKIQFNRDIRPILSDNCFRCHGPDKNHRKAKLRLDVREVALEREAFVPGKPAESELIRRINATNEDDVMPPPSAEKRLTPEQKQLLADWIAQGAEYQPHWAYITPGRPAVPEVKNRAWVRNPIDAFVLRELEARNLQPSPEADRATLLRRLSLDLTGLPPTPAEVEAFRTDSRPDAYERRVDWLLASPHYGERMAVPWLDVARYADTVGYHGDQPQNVFPYRDYVINAFNANKPFDQFTIEQLAGDLLPNPTVEQKIATGFNRLNMMTREGGAQPKEYLAKYAADRVRTVSAAWLGSTMGCAECHDHKYDPFTTKDFYQMEAFFADIRQWGVYADYGYTPNPDLQGFGNDHPFPPEIEVDSPYLQRRIQTLRDKLHLLQADAAKKLGADRQTKNAFAGWQAMSRAFLRQAPDGWLAPHPAVALGMKNTNAVAATNFAVLPDATISFTREPRASTRIELPLTNQWLAAIRLEVVPQKAGEAHPSGTKKTEGQPPATRKGARKQPAQKKAARKSVRANPSDIRLSASLRAGGRSVPLAFSFADADHQELRYSLGLPVPGLQDVWKLAPDHASQTAVWLLNPPVNISSNATLILNLGAAEVASLRVSVSPFAADEPLRAGADASLRVALNRMALFRSDEQRHLLERAFLLSTDADTNFLARAHALQGEIRECRGGRSPTQITVAREPMVTRVLPRGNWQDESGEIVQPASPHFLPQLPDVGTRRQTRLDLAGWLVSPENPLTARAVMNRFWKEFFGRGLSAVVDDLGAQGEPPSHPELLDWLAVEFRERGWNVKHMVKLMVLSATYRQACGPRSDLKEMDPNNRLLACQTPRRLDAEFVRDNALAIAGLLNEDLGGPSAHPYQPAGYYANLQFPDRHYHADADDRQYRRGLYTWWQRTFLQPMLANFDAPSREECTALRTVSNTPQQALTLLNDPTFVECARVFAARICAAPAASDAERLDRVFERALARPAKPAECASLKQFLSAQRAYYRGQPQAAEKLLRVGHAPEPRSAGASELAAWTQVCRVVLNLHETITRY
jgi:mono/diheme cytochrome c family protein